MTMMKLQTTNKQLVIVMVVDGSDDISSGSPTT
jgi:hypothetical protein